MRVRRGEIAERHTSSDLVCLVLEPEEDGLVGWGSRAEGVLLDCFPGVQHEVAQNCV